MAWSTSCGKNGLQCRRKVLRRHYYDTAVGHNLYPQILYHFAFKQGGRAAVEICLHADRRYNKKLFDHLREQCEDSEDVFIQALEWSRLDYKAASLIATPQCDGSIEDNDQTLNSLQDWMVNRAKYLDKVLGPIMDTFVP